MRGGEVLGRANDSDTCDRYFDRYRGVGANDDEGPALRFPGIHRSCYRRCAVQALSSNDFSRGAVDAFHARRFRGHRVAAFARAGLRACGIVRALSRRRKLSCGASEQSTNAERVRSGRTTLGAGIRGGWQRGYGDSEASCAHGHGLHSRAQHDGGMLHIPSGTRGRSIVSFRRARQHKSGRVSQSRNRINRNGEQSWGPRASHGAPGNSTKLVRRLREIT